MQPKTERFEMRLDPGTLEKVDGWRSRQGDLPSRAEAVRRLMETGLTAEERKPLKFSDGEKLITLMLCEFYKHLKIDGEIDPSFVEAAFHGGRYWGLEWEYSGIFHGHEDSEKTVREVVDVLDMWRLIERSHAKLSKKDKERVEKEAEPYGRKVEFQGFDGNDESEHMGVADFMINKLNRFSEFKNRELNSHSFKIDGYRCMVRTFKPMMEARPGMSLLNAGQIIELLNAQSHAGW
jgi:uncharacterized protein YfbU (UPF0304 family)|tara:strand:- start:7903 stop:8610 length:708 start_codon:yes stop_codon:yes gene_type:complete